MSSTDACTAKILIKNHRERELKCMVRVRVGITVNAMGTVTVIVRAI